jgi:cyanate permease
MIVLALFHRLLHPHLKSHIHLRPLNLTVGTWQLALWALTLPAGWALYRFVYQRRRARQRLAWGMFGAVVVFQATAYVTFAIWRNADVLLVLLWLSLLSLLAGASLLPALRTDSGPRPGTAGGGPRPAPGRPQ